MVLKILDKYPKVTSAYTKTKQSFCVKIYTIFTRLVNVDRLIKVKRYRKYLVIMIVLLLMFYLNIQSQPKTIELSNKVRDILINTVFINNPEFVRRYIRKIGHFLEFLMLGLVSYLVLKTKSLIICPLISLIDQSLKIVIPSRHFDITDLPIDFMGYVLGISLSFIADKLIKNK